jgi:hypothetical protein
LIIVVYLSVSVWLGEPSTILPWTRLFPKEMIVPPEPWLNPFALSVTARLLMVTVAKPPLATTPLVPLWVETLFSISIRSEPEPAGVTAENPL